MNDFLPVLAYFLSVAYIPLVYATVKALRGGRWRNATFMKAVAKDFFRTLPVVALVWIPVFILPATAKWYAFSMHILFSPVLVLEIGHIKQFGARVGLNTFYSLFVTNRQEFREFCAQNVTIRDWVAVAAVFSVPLFILPFMPEPSFSSRVVQVVSIAVSTVLFLPFVFNFFKKGNRFKIGYVLNPYSSLVYHWFEFRRTYSRLKRMIEENSASPFEGIRSSLDGDRSGREVYVVVLGESSNSMHCSCYGYPRPTNEFTDALGERIIRVKGVVSPFAQTLPVLERVLTFADSTSPGLLYEKGSVIDYFKAAGFRTYWLTNQYALEDTAITAMAGHADVCRCFNYSDMKRFERAGFDGDMIDELDKVLDEPYERKIIFLHMIGSHSAYNNRYPAEFALFKDSPPGNRNLSPAACQMVNTYDDSVRYSDWVVSKFIEKVEARNVLSFLLYFSDHGEDIYDSTNDRILGHSQLANEPMTSVPFMLWTSRRYDEARPDIRRRNIRQGYNTENVIHTIIDLASLSNADFIPEKSVFVR